MRNHFSQPPFREKYTILAGIFGQHSALNYDIIIS